MVTLTIKTSPKGFENANYLLRMACDQLEENPEIMKKMSLSKADIKAVKDFRAALVKAVENSMNS